MRSGLLPVVGAADLSDSPPREYSAPAGWPGHIVPNFSEWCLGDIVLVHSDGSAKDVLISAGQAASRSRATRDGCMFVHAAVYVGDDSIVDMTVAHGLAKRSIWPYCQTNPIVLRRIPNLTLHERFRIADEAELLARGGHNYSWWSLILSKLVPGTVPDPQNLYCSTFVGEVVDRGCGLQLYFQPAYRPLYPGTLAEHQALDVVDLEWRPL